MRLNILCALLGLVAGGAVVWHFRPQIASEVNTSKDQSRTVTVITEEPGGAKKTTIVSTETKNQTNAKNVPVQTTKNYYVTLGYGYNFYSERRAYTAAVHKRLFGDIWVGVQGGTDESLFLLLGSTF